MPASLLDSQLEALQPLDAGEGITVDIDAKPAAIVDRILAAR